jgi:hypothetical protein
MAKTIFKIIGFQFALFFAHQLLMYFLIVHLRLFTLSSFEVLIVGAHLAMLLILMITSFTDKKTANGIAYLISLLLLLVIGFGSCANIVFR